MRDVEFYYVDTSREDGMSKYQIYVQKYVQKPFNFSYYYNINFNIWEKGVNMLCPDKAFPDTMYAIRPIMARKYRGKNCGVTSLL